VAIDTVVRPERGEYLMSIAIDVAARCNCRTTVVGAVITRDGRIASTGYNGTVVGYTNCIDGGCPRCADPEAESGTQLDRCICVHAEQNALLAAARFGIGVEGAECWVTTDPCLDCTKSLIQARVRKVVYWQPYRLPRPESEELRSSMREHAANITVLEQWKPDSDVLELQPRYDRIKVRLRTYVEKSSALLSPKERTDVAVSK
jgi:dCMP deaminase